jgi:hypothetical protein
MDTSKTQTNNEIELMIKKIKSSQETYAQELRKGIHSICIIILFSNN